MSIWIALVIGFIGGFYGMSRASSGGGGGSLLLRTLNVIFRTKG